MMDDRINIRRNNMDFITNEAYKALRTNIQFCGDDVKVILLTSCTPDEGKSSVSFNLSVSLAEDGKRVLFIDADLRKSVIIGRYKVWGVEKGLTHYLSGQSKLDEVIKQTDIDNMDMIFAGSYPPNPAELLNHARFGDMIKMLRDDYDYIIIDTPPLGNVIDSAIVARVCDGAIMVVEANSISYRFTQSIKQQLEKTGCRILGVVLNKIPTDKNGYYGKYYGKRYSKYYYG